VRVLSDEDFVRGQAIGGQAIGELKNIHVGGPKGIDIDDSMSILVTTCEVRTLTFFDFAQILEWISDVRQRAPVGGKFNTAYINHCPNQEELELKYELHRLDVQHQSAKAIAEIRNSMSWRCTAPLRRASGLVSKSSRLLRNVVLP
jgi:hypothetical protein